MRLSASPSNTSRLGELFLVAFAILALELAIIRWMAQQVRLFGYLSNVLLIGSFLGLGLGIGLGARRPRLFAFTLPVLALLAAILALAGPLGLIRLSLPDDAIQMWGLAGSGPFVRNLMIVVGLFSVVVAVFVCAGSRMGEIFSKTDSLPAYSADLGGSLAGVLAITAVAALQTSPPVWFALSVLPLAWLARRWWSWLSAGVVIFFAWLSVGEAVFSPYYRIDIDRATTVTGAPLRLSVNRDFHQYLNDLSRKRLTDPSTDPQLRQRLQAVEQMYRFPFLVSPNKNRALIVGAGTGNDAAAALREGFAETVAVEIDPRIISIGRAIHPERPYDDGRVRVVVNDARAYFEQNRDQTFDSIAFGLLDSHAMFSAMSSLRLDNYVYTEESLRSAWRQLRSPGVLSLSFASGHQPWLSDRLYAVLRDATGEAPLIVPHGLQNGRFYVVAKGMDLPAVLAKFGVRTIPPGALAENVRVPTDDWPFLYLRPGVVPVSYLLVLSVILLFALVGGRLVFGRSIFQQGRFDPALFLMGAAFLLIETRGVTSLSLLFGSTWIVNAVVFAGILTVALCANLYVQWRPIKDIRIPLVLLFLTLTLNYLVSAELLLGLPVVWRGVVGGILNGVPVGLAGLTFSALFSTAKEPDAALGSNLLGAVVGGCVEYFSMLVGLRSLALLALVLYLGVFLITLRHKSRLFPVRAEK